MVQHVYGSVAGDGQGLALEDGEVVCEIGQILDGKVGVDCVADSEVSGHDDSTPLRGDIVGVSNTVDTDVRKRDDCRNGRNNHM